METYEFNGVKIQLEFYCPKNPVTRAEAALFIELALHGPGYWPPAPAGWFDDVPVDHWAAGWIEQLVVDGLDTGCDERLFCPDELVSRAQLAVMVGKVIYTDQTTFVDQPSGHSFVDVEAQDWAADYIQQLASEGIISGCQVGKYCPDEAVSRAELAALIVKAFNIPTVDDSGWIVDQ